MEKNRKERIATTKKSDCESQQQRKHKWSNSCFGNYNFTTCYFLKTMIQPSCYLQIVFDWKNLQDHFDTEQNKKDVFRIKDGHLFGG